MPQLSDMTMEGAIDLVIPWTGWVLGFLFLAPIFYGFWLEYQFRND